MGPTRFVRLRPAPNSLALLRICSRVNGEIGDKWLSQVLFSFEDVGTMLDKLTNLDQKTLAKLRYMRFSEQGMIRVPSPGGSEHGYGLTHFLKLLPGLCLDRLTVLRPTGTHWKGCRYRALDVLINHSNGWKELYYLSNNSTILGWSRLDQTFNDDLRAPQPSDWNRALTSRDGPTASVSIYRSSNAADHGAMLSKPATRQAFPDQSAEPGKNYGDEEDAALMAPGEREKELLVVARRGNGVDCTASLGLPQLLDDIRERWRGMTWAEIYRTGRDWFDIEFSSDSEDEYDDEVSDCPVKVDTYNHVDDYEWSLEPFHLNLNSAVPL